MQLPRFVPLRLPTNRQGRTSVRPADPVAECDRWPVPFGHETNMGA